MNFKKTKKKIHRSMKRTKKVARTVPLNLITENRFNEIVKILSGQEKLSRKERYLYGYALFQLNQELDALVTLWPLTVNGNQKLKDDCSVIATYVFGGRKSLDYATLPDDKLLTLFSVAKELYPQSKIYLELKCKVFNILWGKNAYEQLERILKRLKDEPPGVLLENLSKLAFLQYGRKMASNLRAFVSYVLTGGACLIQRNPIYHDDIAGSIRLLGNELKHTFFQLETTNKSTLNWSRSLFDQFVDYEADILIQVLQLILNDSTKEMSIIPTPSYLMIYDPMRDRIGQDFLHWLATKDKSILDIYNDDNYYAIFWALTGKELPNTDGIRKLISRNEFDPYLHFALMLRAEKSNDNSLKKLFQLNGFKLTDRSKPLYKDVILKTVKAIMDEGTEELSLQFWQLLSEFNLIEEDEHLKNRFSNALLQRLHNQIQSYSHLEIESIKVIAKKIKAEKLMQNLDALLARLEECKQFVAKLTGKKKKSNKRICSFKEESALRAHLTLLADVCLLLHDCVPIDVFRHIELIVNDKSLNKLIPLKELFDFDFNCRCFNCKTVLYFDIVPVVAATLNLPTIKLPTIAEQPTSKSEFKAEKLGVSIFSEDNPFDILGVDLVTSKKDIMKKIQVLIGKFPNKMSKLRWAQNELFNPSKRFLHQYCRYMARDPQTLESDRRAGLLRDAVVSPPKIPFRSELYT